MSKPYEHSVRTGPWRWVGVDEQQTEDDQHQQKSEANLQGPIKEPEMNEEI